MYVPIIFKSYKSAHDVHYEISGEIIAFSDYFDTAAIFAEKTRALINKNISIQIRLTLNYF